MGRLGVPTNALVQLGFSERMDALTVNSATFQVYPPATGIPIAGSYAVSADGLSATFTPSALLAASTVYYVNVSGVSDVVGQVASTFISFTTGAGAQTVPLTVVAVSPPNASTGVPLNAYVAVELSAPVSPVTVGNSAITVSANGSNVAGAITLSSDRQTVTFTPTSALAASTSYTVTLGSIADAAGNLVGPFTSSFTTGASAVPDTTGPTAVAVTPANGSTLTDNSTPVVITFSEVINPATATNILVRDQSNNYYNIAGTWSVSGAQATFTPASPYPANSLIQVWTQDLVRDLAGNTDTAYVVTTFTTANVRDATAPTVISVTPSNGATGVGLNAQPVVTFSKSLNPATVTNNDLALFANGSRIGYVNGISADTGR